MASRNTCLSKFPSRLMVLFYVYVYVRYMSLTSKVAPVASVCSCGFRVLWWIELDRARSKREIDGMNTGELTCSSVSLLLSFVNIARALSDNKLSALLPGTFDGLGRLGRL